MKSSARVRREEQEEELLSRDPFGGVVLAEACTEIDAPHGGVLSLSPRSGVSMRSSGCTRSFLAPPSCAPFAPFVGHVCSVAFAPGKIRNSGKMHARVTLRCDRSPCASRYREVK